MAEQAYCIRCKKKVDVNEGKIIYYKNGVPAERGKCANCGGLVNRILTKPEREALKRGVPTGQ